MSKYNLYFTLDYEIHGNGEGDPMKMMVEPTYRLMTLLEKYGQKLTIMADVAEILCFKRYAVETGHDDYHVAYIEAQLCEAIKRGHDVQLHVHSSYFKAVHQNGAFDQCIEEYNMAALPIERIDEIVAQCVTYLQTLLKPIKKDYRVWLFRAANWSMMPTENLYCVLVRHGITHDTSVFKGGVQGGNVCYDYREAHDNLFAYPASVRNINEYDAGGQLVEMPIYTEMRPFWDFVSVIRVFRMIRAKFHKHKHAATDKSGNERVKELTQAASRDDNRKLSIKSFFRLSPLKMDFNQVNARGLKRMMKNVMRRVEGQESRAESVNVVLIGHSKTFVPYNEKTLEPFLQWVSNIL